MSKPLYAQTVDTRVAGLTRRVGALERRPTAAAAASNGEYAKLWRWDTAQTIPNNTITTVLWDGFWTTNNSVFYTTTVLAGPATNTSGDGFIHVSGAGNGAVVFVLDVLWNAAGAANHDANFDSDVVASAFMSQVSRQDVFATRDTPVAIGLSGGDYYASIRQTSGVSQTASVRLAMTFVPLATNNVQIF